LFPDEQKRYDLVRDFEVPLLEVTCLILVDLHRLFLFYLFNNVETMP
jgi:hypothetical protein